MIHAELGHVQFDEDESGLLFFPGILPARMLSIECLIRDDDEDEEFCFTSMDKIELESSSSSLSSSSDPSISSEGRWEPGRVVGVNWG